MPTLKESAQTLEMTILELAYAIQDGKFSIERREGKIHLSEEQLLAYLDSLTVSTRQPSESRAVAEPLAERPSVQPAPVLPILVSALPTALPTLAQKIPEPEPPWKQPAREILGEKYALYLRKFGELKSEKVTTTLLENLSLDYARQLLQHDPQETIFTLKNGDLLDYVLRVERVREKINRRYNNNPPENFQWAKNPRRFLPGNVSGLEQELEAARRITPSAGTAAVLFERLNMDPLTAQRMVQEGHNPPYVWAIVVKGFKVGTGWPRIGEQYQEVQHWENNIDNAFRSLGISPDKRELQEEKRKLEYLVTYKKQGECVSLSPHWANQAAGAIREYLLQVMPPGQARHGQ